MAELRTLQNKRLSDLTGKVFETPPPPIIELEIYGDKWVPNNHPSIGYVQFYSRGANTAYIDYGDGSPVEAVTIPSAGWIIWDRLNNVHLYPRKDYWKVKIWFLKPELIIDVQARYVELVGKFPSQLALYPIRSIYMINNIKFDEFPDDVAPGYFDSIQFKGITRTKITYIPKWIYLSRIKSLVLADLDIRGANTNIDKLINIQDLEILSIDAAANNSSFPANISQIASLRILGMCGTWITEITPEINGCKQIKTLNFGYGSHSHTGGGNLVSWGVGVANMPNLTYLSYNACTNATTDYPTGLETSGVKTVANYGTFQTVERIDEHVTKMYNKVITIATFDNSSSILKNINYQIGSNISTVQNAVPSGTYQAPSGYIQGINNGTPVSPKEMLYVLVNQYNWVITAAAVGVGNGTSITYKK